MQQWHRWCALLMLPSLIGCLGLFTPLQAAAEKPCFIIEEGRPTYQVDRAYQLSEAIPETTSPAQLPHSFHEAGMSISMAEDERVLLSGSEQGSGFFTDDQITIVTMPERVVTQIDFREPDRVGATEPLEITGVLSPGRNSIAIEMMDLMWPSYASSAYWLLILKPCTTLDATPVVWPAVPAGDDGSSPSTTVTERGQTPAVAPPVTWHERLLARLTREQWLVGLSVLGCGLVWRLQRQKTR